jgi:hypothetical protein
MNTPPAASPLGECEPHLEETENYALVVLGLLSIGRHFTGRPAVSESGSRPTDRTPEPHGQLPILVLGIVSIARCLERLLHPGATPQPPRDSTGREAVANEDPDEPGRAKLRSLLD